MIFRSKQIIFIGILVVINCISKASTPVHYGGDEVLDACSSFAEVYSLSKGPDGFLAVKDAPDIKSKRIDKIFNGQKLWICEKSRDEKWLGIVYTKSTKQDCGVHTTIEASKVYSGPCLSGWVSKKYVKILAE